MQVWIEMWQAFLGNDTHVTIDLLISVMKHHTHGLRKLNNHHCQTSETLVTYALSHIRVMNL